MTRECVLHRHVCTELGVVRRLPATTQRPGQYRGQDCSCLRTLSPCTMSSKGTVRFLPVASSMKPVACTHQRQKLRLNHSC